MDGLHLYLFGSTRLEWNGRLVEMDTRKAMALLALLAISGVEQRREVLVTLLYPESDDESGRAAFRRTLSTLNHALGAGVLAARRDAVGLDPAAGLWVDVLEFKSQLVGQPSPAALERAAVLYRGDFMAGFSLRDSPDFDDWQYRQSEELRHLLAGALARLADLAADQGELERAVQYALRRISLDPLIEEGHRQLMEIYARSGQRSAAILQYRECVRILEHELGVSPLAETTHLYQEILSGRVQAHTRESSSATRPASTSPPSLPVATSFPLVGRDAEFGILHDALQTNPRDGLFISLEGEAGVGKTRLAEEFLAAARKAGRVVLPAACYDGEEELAYSPFFSVLQKALDWTSASASDEGQTGLAERLERLPGEVLAEAVRLLPGLARLTRQAVPVPLPEGPGAQARFFEALRSLFVCLLGGELPGIIFIDDLQWADSATLDLLTYLVRRLAHGNYWILGTWRSQQGVNSERLRLLQAEQRRTGRGLHLLLQRLNAGDIERLAQLQLGAGEKDNLPPGLAQRLFTESEGLPFIALEYLRSFDASRADWNIPTHGEGAWKMVGGVRDLLYRRLMTPGEAARQLLTAAAVIGRVFDLKILQAVSGRSELETITGIEELLGLGLLGEYASGYDFTHHKLREVAYEETSLARRRLLHQRAAEFLVSASQNRAESAAAAGLAAGHFMQAGQAVRAAEYYSISGEYARRVYANDEALTAFQAALAAGHPDPAGIHEACGDLYTLQGNYREALSSFQAAAAFCALGCLSKIMHKLGEIHHRLGEWEAAEGHYQAAFDAAGQDDSPAWLAHLFSDWSLTLYRRGQMEAAQRLAHQALSQAQAADDPGAIAQSLNMLGILSRAAGKLEEASEFLKASFESAARQDDLRMRYAVLNNLARLEQERGRITGAIALAREALALCTRMGDRHRQAAILNNLADLYHTAGLDEEAMAELKKAVTIFAEVGENSGPGQPEIWKLTEW